MQGSWRAGDLRHVCLLALESQTAGSGWLDGSGEQGSGGVLNPRLLLPPPVEKAHLELSFYTFALNSSVLGPAQRTSAEENILRVLEVHYPICSGINKLSEGSVNQTEALTLLFVGEGTCRRRSQ